jgi:hypothetical protein
MDFQQTSLPDKQIFRDAFNAGWEKYKSQPGMDAQSAAEQYQRGPIAMARLIYEHGGECRQIAAAACLAGPAIFSEHPAEWLNKKLVEFSRELRGVGTTPAGDLYGIIPGLSGDARLLLQASAIMLLEHVTGLTAEAKASGEDCQKTYTQALELYSCARGTRDTFKLDTRFEIAAMKATTVMEAQPHIWARARDIKARIRV